VPRIDPNAIGRLLLSFWIGTLAALFFHSTYIGVDDLSHYAEEGAIVVLTGLLVFGAIEMARRRR
jgi:alpha-beta hydrolase superfamily lysophospholipase